MKMRTLRRLRTHMPRRRDFDTSDATMEPDPGPPPEAVFDRATGPWDRRRFAVALPGAADEET